MCKTDDLRRPGFASSGWMVAPTADIIFASDDALFRPMSSAFTPHDIHPRRAKEILFGRYQ